MPPISAENIPISKPVVGPNDKVLYYLVLILFFPITLGYLLGKLISRIFFRLTSLFYYTKMKHIIAEILE
jgi:hypothetical protein